MNPGLQLPLFEDMSSVVSFFLLFFPHLFLIILTFYNSSPQVKQHTRQYRDLDMDVGRLHDLVPAMVAMTKEINSLLYTLPTGLLFYYALHTADWFVVLLCFTHC